MKKNNKGFSLVELIVVVLIMAIIAVALAPQVMKWVENSRLSTDVSNYDSMVANLQLALTDKNAYAENMKITAESDAVLVEISSEVTTMTGGGSAGCDKLKEAMTKIDGSWEAIKQKVTDADPYQIKIYGGVVYRVEDAQPDTAGNADLS